MAMQALLRMLFYLSPIYVPPKGSIVEMLMKFNLGIFMLKHIEQQYYMIIGT